MPLRGRTGVGARPHTGSGGVEVSRDDLADDLMSGDNSWIEWRQFAFDNVKIGAADSAGEYTEENMARLELGLRNVFNFEWGLRDW
jgi:hypothetical protein